MATALEKLVNSVLLAATDSSVLEDPMKRFLAEGGRTVLFGETREEYVAREMSAERVARESLEGISAQIDLARAAAGPILVAVDQEIGGIQRLSHLLAAQPKLSELHRMSEQELSDRFSYVALSAKRLGVNMFLAPIVDTLSGPNPWLSGRTVSNELTEVSRISRIFVRSAEAADVMAVVKHFPGHAHVPLDPAVDVQAVVEGTLEEVSAGFPAFETCIAEGAGGMMLGPAPVLCIDTTAAATCSKAVVDLLTGQLGFQGLLVSDGLEAAATSTGRPVAQVAVQALNAGLDLLLVSGDERLPHLATDIAAAVERDELPVELLRKAADRVGRAIDRYAA